MTTQKLGDRLMVVYGPPGTGKTTRLLELLETELEHLPPEKIAFVTFTRTARTEARDRALVKFDLSPEQLTWFRTLHSTGLAMLGTSNKLFNSTRLKEFCEHYSYDLTSKREENDGDELGMPPMKTGDDDLRSVHEWGRHRLMTLHEAWSKGPTLVDLAKLELYVERYLAFKREHDLIDFADMLEKGMADRPPVQVAIVDEAQDLSPLQINACYAWFGDCERVYVAGDDDQSTFLFAGADPQWMIDLQKVCDHYELLEKSYRVPEAVRVVANRIIRRNSRRVNKPYRSAKAGGHVECMTQTQAITATVERIGHKRWTTYVLVRNRMFVKRWVEDFLREGVPYLSEVGDKGPLGHARLVKAVLAVNKLLQGQDIDGVELRIILTFVPSGLFAPRGAKVKARAFNGNLSRMQLILEWNLADLMNRFEERGPAMGLFKVRAEHLQYLDLVLKRLGTLPTDPNVRIMTIHGSKGREANTVIVSSDMARASWLEWQREEEGENRVAYVAVTRAKDELLICDPETPRFYPYWEFTT